MRLDKFIVESGLASRTEIAKAAKNGAVTVNGVEVACIHISSIEEASEEKLDEIIQMLSDSLVVINTDEWFIWRD